MSDCPWSLCRLEEGESVRKQKRRHERYSGDSRFVAGAESVEGKAQRVMEDINANRALLVPRTKRAESGDNVKRRSLVGAAWMSLRWCQEGLGSDNAYGHCCRQGTELHL